MQCPDGDCVVAKFASTWQSVSQLQRCFSCQSVQHAACLVGSRGPLSTPGHTPKPNGVMLGVHSLCYIPRLSAAPYC